MFQRLASLGNGTTGLPFKFIDGTPPPLGNPRDSLGANDIKRALVHLAMKTLAPSFLHNPVADAVTIVPTPTFDVKEVQMAKNGGGTPSAETEDFSQFPNGNPVAFID